MDTDEFKKAFPGVNTAIKAIAESNGQFYADCVDLMAQLTLTQAILEQSKFAIDPLVIKTLNSSTSWFGQKIIKEYSVTPDTLKKHLVAVSLAAIADF